MAKEEKDIQPLECMTPEQRIHANSVVTEIISHAQVLIDREGPRITAMDKRPNQVWSEEQPDVFFRYVNQNLLEELIRQLEELV